MTRFLRPPPVLAALALALLQLPLAARATAGDTNGPAFADPIVATGKGFAIKRSQVDEAFLNYIVTSAATGGAIPDQDRPMIRSNLLQHLIINQILLQKATADEKLETQKMVDDAIADARKRAPSPEAFDAQIKATGMSLEQVRNRAVEEQLCRRVLINETTNGIVVSDQDIKKFYDDNPKSFEMPERVRAAHILISTLDPLTRQPLPPDQKKEKKKLAEEIKARADKGEDFGALVKKYSDDPGSKDKGGEYTFPRGKMVPEFEAAAFSLKVNQISDLVETQFGYHIIKLLEKLPPSKEELAKASPDIRDHLVKERAEKALPSYLDRIQSDANVKILDRGDGTAAAAPK
jgi:peptidyl-prolyl cis-trans isomerase C